MAIPKGFKSNQDLRKMDKVGLMSLLEEQVKKLFKASFEVKSGQSKRSDLIKKYRKQIARIKTVLAALEKKVTEEPEESKEKGKAVA